MSRSLIVLPDDSAKPILDAINGAREIASGQDVRFLRPSTAAGGAWRPDPAG